MSLGWYSSEDELRQEVEKAFVWIECWDKDQCVVGVFRAGCFVSYKVKSGEIRKGLISSYDALGFDEQYITSVTPVSANRGISTDYWVVPTKLELRRTNFSYAFESDFFNVALLELMQAEVQWFEANGGIFLEMDGSFLANPGDNLLCLLGPLYDAGTLSFETEQVVAAPQPWIIHNCELTSSSIGGSPILKLSYHNNLCTYELVGIQSESENRGTSTEVIMNAIHADKDPFDQDPIQSDDELICTLFGVDMTGAKDLDPSISKVTQGSSLYSNGVFYTLECDRGIRISVEPTYYFNLFTLMYAPDRRFEFVPWRNFTVEQFKGFYKLAAALQQNKGDEWLKAVEKYLRNSSKVDLAEHSCPGQIVDAVDNIKWLVMTKDGPRKLAQAVIETKEPPQQKEQIQAQLEQFDSGAITEVCLVEGIADFLERCHQSSQFQSRLLTDFEPIKPLGSGGFGVVYKCRKKVDDGLYAVKRICISNSEKRENIRREVLTLTKLFHEGIVRYYHAWEEEPPLGWMFPGDVANANSDSCSSVVQSSLAPSSNNLPSSNSVTSSNPTYLYIQMELCDTSLHDWLDEHRSGTTRDHGLLFNWLFELSCAIEHVHKKEIIHRDLKPANIFISDGQLKIGDFGWATFEESMETDQQRALIKGPAHTASVGTYTYRAPEQRKHENYSYPVDVFSLGLIFVELLIPFGTDHERLDTFQLIRDGALPEKLQQMPDLGDLVKSMTLEAREERVKINDVVSMVQKLKSEVD